MSVVIASELLSCAGRPLSSPAGLSVEVQPQVPDEEAVTDSFIPADSLSAVLLSPRRVLVTAGVLSDDRVLPLTVLRFLDLDAAPRWSKPLQLRARAKRKRADSAFPVCRIEQTLTLIPDIAALLLVGGLKVGGRDEGTACKTLFAFDLTARVWESITLAHTPKPARDQALGPRFAHTAVYVPRVGPETRSSKARKSSGFILIYGGYASINDDLPSNAVHIFDVRARRWALHAPANPADAPRRAYHAGVLTPSARYFVSHGGQCSNFEESHFLSSDLIAFDILRSEWVRPKLMPASCSPPTARKRHCMVNGIGKHQGAIVLFGGELSSGQFSSELFVLRIIEPTASTQSQVYAVWEKADVRSPEALLPIPADNSSAHSSQEERKSKNTATAGGTLLAIPELNKYLVIGGRGAYGIHNSPLLLDPSKAERLDRLEERKIGPRPTEHVETPPAPAVIQRSNNTPVPVVNAATPSWVASRKDTTTSIEGPNNIPEENALPQISDEDNLPILPKLKPPVDRQLQNDVLFSAEQGTPSVRPFSVLPPIRNGASPSVAPSKAAVTGGSLNGKEDEEVDDIRPATSVRPVSAVKIGRPRQTVESDDYVLDLVDNEDRDDDYDARRIREADASGDRNDMETPPTKRRRFINSRRQGSVPSSGKDGSAIGIDTDENPGTAGSDFIAASALARKGKSRAAKSTRGRGRGRGGGRRRRAATIAEDRESLKEKEEEEALLRESDRQIQKLQLENMELRRERDVMKEDNLKLNEQMKGQLSEIQALRNFRREHSRSARLTSRLTSPKRRKGTSSEMHGASQESREVQAVGIRSASNERFADSSESEELRMLQSKTEDLLEEYRETLAERDELNKALREAEEGRRTLEIELHHSKNKFGRLETERDQLRKQASELRTLATSENVAKETATSQLRKAEEGNAALKWDLDRLRGQIHEAECRRTEEKLQLSNAQRLVRTVKGQLNEAQMKYNQFDSKERRLKGELGSQQNRVEELQNVVDRATQEKQKLQEKVIELIAENESLKVDFGTKMKECQTAFKDTEKFRQAFDREKKEATNLDMEIARLRRDLARSKRDYNSLSQAKKKRDFALHALRPALLHITNEIGVLTRSAEEDDLGHSLSQVNRFVPGDHIGKHGEAREMNGERVCEVAVEMCAVTRPKDNLVKGDVIGSSKNPQQHSSPDSEDLKSPVPPSEEEEEP